MNPKVIVVLGVLAVACLIAYFTRVKPVEICNEDCEVCDPKPVATVQAEAIVVSKPKKAKKSKKAVK